MPLEASFAGLLGALFGVVIKYRFLLAAPEDSPGAHITLPRQDGWMLINMHSGAMSRKQDNFCYKSTNWSYPWTCFSGAKRF